MCQTLDSILCQYSTARVVRFKDRRVGCCYWIFLLAIIGYVIVYQLLVKQQYLKFDSVLGSVRMLLGPGGVTKNTRWNYKDFPYCPDYTGKDKVRQGWKPGYLETNVTCRFWDEHDVRYPNTDSHIILTTTVIKSSIQRRTCGQNTTDVPCSPLYPFETLNFGGTKAVPLGVHVYYIAGVDNYQLQISHAAQASTYCDDAASCGVDYAGVASEMEGKYTFLNGTTMFFHPTPLNGTSHDWGDTLPLSVILEGAGIHLDHSIMRTAKNKQTARYSGCVIYIDIEYSNREVFFAPQKLIYEYKISSGNDIESIYQPIYLNQTHRILYQRRGIKLVIRQSGQLGIVDAQTALLTLITGMGLLAVATVLTDKIATHCLSEKNLYSRFKYKEYDISEYKLGGSEQVASPQSKDTMDGLLDGRDRYAYNLSTTLLRHDQDGGTSGKERLAINAQPSSSQGEGSSSVP